MNLLVSWTQGAELAAQDGKSAAALAACRTLAEELTETRFPAPRILAFKVMLNPMTDIPFVYFNLYKFLDKLVLTLYVIGL